jgi:hypothetical protein
MLELLALSIVAVQPAAPSVAVRLDRTARIFSTVGHSEWCPAGNVTLDLKTGRYALTATAPRRICQDVRTERPVEEGTLSGNRLAAVRAAYRRVWAEGVEDPACRESGPARGIVVSNGGTRVLVATSGWASLSAPDDLSCWSEAANDLHDALDEAFGSRRRK